MPPGQSGIAEVLVVPERAVAIQQHRRSLERVSEFVRVRGDRGDPGEAEVEDGDRVPEPLTPGQDEAAHAAVDVQTDVTLQRERRHLLDRVDEPVRIVPRRTDDRDGVGRDVLADPADVGTPVVAHRSLDEPDAEHVRSLLQGDVRREGDDHLGIGDALLHPAPLAVDEHRVDEALGAAERDHPADVLAGMVAGHRIAMKE